MSEGMEQVSIQYQDRTGNWTTVMRVQNLAPNIRIGMDSAARAHPGCRVRAVDDAGRVLDLL
ncbi:hypothetical protein V5F49_07710 [Xanthobacter sp. V3C-3]|uniref:hypothetical protein n=1 Tax=Xanthobacter lutulentifluminis TaxID=3119935 RepID=UPI00372ABC62